MTLGTDPEELGDGSSSFNQLGGDSLAAIQFAREVDELCGTNLPVSFVLDHSHSMQDIVEKASCRLGDTWPGLSQTCIAIPAACTQTCGRRSSRLAARL